MNTYCNEVLCGLVILLIATQIILICNNTEWFGNLKENVGYPRPQGNLPNLEYGTLQDKQKKERKEWDSVLRENFVVPPSRTVLV